MVRVHVGLWFLDDTRRNATGWIETGIDEKALNVVGLRPGGREAQSGAIGHCGAAADFVWDSGDAFDGGQLRCEVFTGDFGVVVSLHVDEEHVAQP
jgi:hypothetical protein